MDVKIAFINKQLDKEIYIKEPIGFEAKENEYKLCHLKRFIGLKQSSGSET